MTQEETDRDWESLAATWRGTAPDANAQELRALVSSRRRRMNLALSAEIAVAAGLVVLTWLRMRHGPDTFDLVWLLTLWSCMVVAAAYSIWSRRGLWKLSGESTTSYVARLRLLCERRRKALRFMIGFLIAEVALVAGELRLFDVLNGTSILLLALLSAAYSIWFVLIARRTRIELREIEAFERDAG